MNIYVDLDGTLVKSDLLFEGVFSLIKQDLRMLIVIPFWLLRGKAYLKNKVFSSLHNKLTEFPFSVEFVNYLNEQKAMQRRIYLATGNCKAISEMIMEKLPIFDGALTTEEYNLTGKKKLEKIIEHAGGADFSYAGNASVDDPILSASAEPILVNPSYALKKRWKNKVPHLLFESKKRGFFKSVLKAMRVHQWTKNALIFVPMLLSHQIYEYELLISAIIAFISLSLIASGTYLFNDLLDIQSDRKHSTKCERPFASADLSVVVGCGLIVILVGVGLFTAYFISLELLLMCLVYLVGTLSYSLYFKSIIILDAINLAGLYTIRIIAGGVVVNTPPTFWLLTFSMFVFLSLALIKRCTELEGQQNLSNKALHGRDYRQDDLSVIRSMGVSSGFISILVVAMYINSEDVVMLYANPQVLWLICPILLYWISRMWIKMGRGEMHVDPVEFSMKDRTSILCGIFIVLAILAAL